MCIFRGARMKESLNQRDQNGIGKISSSRWACVYPKGLMLSLKKIKYLNGEDPD